MVQTYIDSTSIYTTYRYIFLVSTLLLFLLRIILGHGYYIVCYALFIYLLNQFLAFLSPKFDPSLNDESGISNSAMLKDDGGSTGGSGGVLGLHKTDEFKPFIRRLPEFKFWYVVARRRPYF